MIAADDLLLRGIRILRHLDSDADAPWPAVRATMPGGDGVLLVDVDALGADWAGWAADAEGHVVRPIDVLRTSSGHLAVLAPLRERLEPVVDRRRAAGAVLTDGEIVTVAVSLLRGCGELTGEETGEWWLDEAARPVFAATGRGTDAASAAAALLGALAADVPALHRPLGDVVALLHDPDRLARESHGIEERLFAVATPEPLALEVFSPRTARGLSVHVGAALDSEPAATPRSGWAALVGHVDADLADVVSKATTSVWRRLRPDGTVGTARPRRGGPLLVAGVVVAAVVGGAALLPAAAEPEPAASDIASDATAPAADVARSPGPSAESVGEDAVAPPAEGLDLEETVAVLLDARLACGADSACLSEIVADAVRTYPPGPIDLPRDARTVVLLDDFGDVAVARVSATATGASRQLVVIVREDGKWLLRDVHDVAEQP